MGKAIRKKQAIEAAKRPNFPALFSTAGARHKQYAEALAGDIREIIKGYEHYAIRPLYNFVSRTRSINWNTRTRELLRYAFERYRPPPFLYRAWFPTADIARRVQNNPTINPVTARPLHPSIFPGIKEDFCLWYLALAQGRSLYKECTQGLLTKAETHAVASFALDVSIPVAIWRAVILAMGARESDALKLAQTRLSNYPLDDFWRSVARWFVQQDALPSISALNDLLDYIRNRHTDSPEWFIKDHTYATLERACAAWHRETARVGSMCAKHPRWDGIPIEDAFIVRGPEWEQTTWKLHQITTGKELAEEGNKQHHCVSSYAGRCAQGQCSVWSMTRWTFKNEQWKGFHALTIELSRNGEIVQARGYANRLPKADELSVLREWAGKHEFILYSR